MNYQIIRYILGWLIKIEGYFLLFPFAVSLIYRETTGWSFLLCSLLSLLIGWWMTRKKPERREFYAREGFISVALSWLTLSFIGAFPFYISRVIPSFVDAMFESISGFTTTGASILNDLTVLPHSMILWRCFSQWIGGMGVLVFMMAILPLAGGGQNMRMMRAESTGPAVGKLLPKTKHTAVVLYAIYIAMTIIELVLLLAGKMPLFDALCTAFGTAGTGGFGAKNSGMSEYSFYLQNVVTVFMLLFGINFNFYFLFFIGRWKDALGLEEVKWYLAIYGSVVALMVWNLVGDGGNLRYSVHHAAFQVISIMTTTGYSTVDYDLWPQFSKILILMLMFVGGCAGSTAGGIKVSRILIYIKTLKKEMAYLMHPRNVKVLKMNRKPIEHEVLRSANVFMVAYIVIYAVSLLLISLDNYDFTTSFTAVMAALNNIGPGLALIGPTQNFSFFSDFTKIVLMFDMLAGRLEIFPMLLLLVPSTWKR